MDALTPQQILARIRYDTDSQRGSVLDVVQLVTGCAQANASRDLQRILEVHPDLRPKMKDLKFTGRGQRPTPVAPLPVLIEIAWLCPGRHAQAFRRTGARTLCRALGGDLSLIDEIKARHEEVAGTDEQAALLAGTGVSTAVANGQALQPVVSALDVDERRMRLKAMELQCGRDAIELADMLKDRARHEADGRQQIFLEDTAKNLLRTYVPGAMIKSTEDDGLNDPVTLSDVAGNLGFNNLSRAQLQALGKEVARLYREEHDEGPPKHAQFVDGAVRKVCSYFEKDRPLIEEAIRRVL